MSKRKLATCNLQLAIDDFLLDSLQLQLQLQLMPLAVALSGSQVHKTSRDDDDDDDDDNDDDGNLIAIYMANVEWQLLPALCFFALLVAQSS
ncbi:hypothetical protein ACLKA6_007888 [Drosophila palustris]